MTKKPQSIAGEVQELTEISKYFHETNEALRLFFKGKPNLPNEYLYSSQEELDLVLEERRAELEKIPPKMQKGLFRLPGSNELPPLVGPWTVLVKKSIWKKL